MKQHTKLTILLMKKLLLALVALSLLSAPLLGSEEIDDAGLETLAEKEIAFQEAKEEEKLSKEEEEAEKRDVEEAGEMLAKADELEEEPHEIHSAPKIPVYTNKKIEQFIKMYTGKKRHVFEQAIERSGKYLPMIHRIFAEYELPPNLAYLAVVESNFNPTARSHASAVGLWQFMRYTGRIFDLHSSWWHDDRFDPEKSTHAAARYLKALYKEFGEWELALSAYNAGSGRVRRALKKAKRKGQNTDYWSLDLPRETRGYVPTFYAANILFENLESYGFPPLPEQEPEMEREFIDVPGGLSLEALAKSMELEPKVLQELNPNLHKGLTPANFDQISLAVPPGITTDPEKIKDLEKNRKRFWKYHKVRRGDTLWSISRRYGVPLSQVVSFNNLSTRRILRINQRIMLPVASDYQPKHYASKSSTSSGSSNSKDYIYHKVKAGDTWWNIAQRYSTSVKKVKQWNQRLSRKKFLLVGSQVALKKNDVRL